MSILNNIFITELTEDDEEADGESHATKVPGQT